MDRTYPIGELFAVVRKNLNDEVKPQINFS